MDIIKSKAAYILSYVNKYSAGNMDNKRLAIAYIKDLLQTIAAQEDKISRRNMQIKDLKASPQSKGITAYESGKAFKFTEEDVWKDGCQPDISQSSIVDIEFTASSIKELIQQIQEYYSPDEGCIEFNACDEKGRLDISILETDDSMKATAPEIESWKEGKKRLWNSIYTYQIKKVISEDVKL